MRKPLTRKKAVLLCTAALTLGLASFYSVHGRDNGALVEAMPRAPASTPATTSRTPATAGRGTVLPSTRADAPAPLQVASRSTLQATPTADLFAPNNWTPAPPPPPKALPPPPPPPPTAPALPFRFVGLLEETNNPTAFLASGDKLLLVKAGDTLEQVYRVDAVSAREITLTYLPLKEQQSILVAGNP